MNKRQILASLNKIANELDNLNLNDEADKITNVMTKIAQTQDPTSQGSAIEALQFYIRQFSGESEAIRRRIRKTLDAVLANYQDKKQFFDDPQYGAELKKLITNDMNLFNSLLQVYNNLPK